MKRWLVFLLVIPAGLLIVGLLSVSFFVLSFFPPLVTWIAVGMMAVVGGWLWFGRRASSNLVAGSETSLMGRQSSKEGLL